MIKDGKFVSTEFPQYEINWGMLDSEDKTKIKAWLTENITNLYFNVMMNIKDTALCRSYIDTLVNDIYDNICIVKTEVFYGNSTFSHINFINYYCTFTKWKSRGSCTDNIWG